MHESVFSIDQTQGCIIHQAACCHSEQTQGCMIHQAACCRSCVRPLARARGPCKRQAPVFLFSFSPFLVFLFSCSFSCFSLLLFSFSCFSLLLFCFFKSSFTSSKGASGLSSGYNERLHTSTRASGLSSGYNEGRSAPSTRPRAPLAYPRASFWKGVPELHSGRGFQNSILEWSSK
jgi:hypothetical protein